MAIFINHQNPNTIYLGFEGDWGWLALKNKLQTAFAIMRKSPTQVDLVFDFTYSPELPQHPVANLDSLRPYLPANLGKLRLIVPDSTMIDQLYPAYESYKAAGLRMVILPTQMDSANVIGIPNQVV